MKVIPKVNIKKTNNNNFMFSASTKFETTNKAINELFSDLSLSKGVENSVKFLTDVALGDEEYKIVVAENIEITASSEIGHLRALATLKQLVFQNLPTEATKCENGRQFEKSGKKSLSHNNAVSKISEIKALSHNNSLSKVGKNPNTSGLKNKPLSRELQDCGNCVLNVLNGNIALIPHCEIIDAPRFSYRGYMLDVSRHFFEISTIKKILDAMWLLKLNVFHLHLCDNQGFRLEIESLPKLHEVGSIRKQTRGDGIEVKGYFTKSDIAQIVEYATMRGIEVIPEIDMPGHTLAMLAAYPELSCTEEKFEVGERFGIVREILCAGKESVFEFLFKLLDEVAEMFPSKYVHIGGDEAPKYQWEECEKCKSTIEKNDLRDSEDLQGYFTNRIVEHLKKLGKTTIVWNESLNSGILEKSAICQYWSDGKVPERVFAAADRGRKTIVSKFSPYYLDYPYGMFSLKKTYLFEPLMDGMSTQAMQNVIGIESPLWTEFVEDESKLFYQTFPRLVAVAESAWSNLDKDFDEFVERLDLVQRMLANIGIVGASTKESLPNPIKGAIKVLKFGLNAMDKGMIKSLINAQKAKQIKRQ